MSSEDLSRKFLTYRVGTDNHMDIEEYPEESGNSVNMESVCQQSLVLNTRCRSATSQPQAEANVTDENSSLGSPHQPAIALMKVKNPPMRTVDLNIVQPTSRPKIQQVSKVLLEKKIIEYCGQKHDCTASRKEFAVLYRTLLPEDYLESRDRSSFNERIRLALNNLCKDGVLRKLKGDTTTKGGLYQYTNRHLNLETLQARAEALNAEKEALLARIAQLEENQLALKQNLFVMTEDRNAWREMARREW